MHFQQHEPELENIIKQKKNYQEANVLKPILIIQNKQKIIHALVIARVIGKLQDNVI